MKKNMGTTDRIIRIAAALVLGYLAYYKITNANLVLVLTIVSIILFITAAFGTCPLYTILGIQTTPRKQDNTVAGHPKH
ncbi:Protein of unknown function [Chitinophaga rupis]|uniref:Inner membrane protein YgaP-like transmembrane domain-containing protein n=1 Tax=Chitinophaga rupis TaxID=573321 RepID=A0A1H7PYC5_9BACT|nr:DUF2892 domain-containing protein [Chitinophaga rupis]SEL40742.1 Protein of unknown function [Chitinophaga rupis]